MKITENARAKQKKGAEFYGRFFMEKLIYAAPESAGRETGTIDHPFSSVTVVRDWIRAQRKKGKLTDRTVRVILRGGVYPVTEALELTEEDSDVIWCAAEGEEVVLEGGHILSAGQFVPIDPETAKNLKSEAARGAVLQCDLRAVGIDIGTLSEKTEFFEGAERKTIARYPSHDFLRGPAGLHEQKDIPDVTGIVGSWHSVQGVVVQGYFPIDYWRHEAKVLSYDREKKTFELSSDELRTGSPFIFYNVFDELSEPGEYYIDRENGMLYVYPDEGFATERLVLSHTEGAVIRMTQAHDITWRGITLEGGRGKGIEGKGERLCVDGCTVQNVFECGVELVGCGHRIVNCEIRSIGASGTVVSGGDCRTLRPAEIVVDNNHIHHYSQRSGTYNAAVSCSNFIEAGFRISHNCIHDSIHNGIMVASGDTFVEYNEIYNVCTEANDAGAIYFGRWEIQNLVFRYNYIHDIYNRYGFGNPHAIYNDDGGSGKVAYGNVMLHIAGDGFAFGGGNNNVMYNNIMIDCGRPLSYDSRQYYGGWEHDWTEFPGGLDWRFLYNNKSYLSHSWVVRYARLGTMRCTGVENRESRFMAGAVGNAAYYGNVEVACKWNRNIEDPTAKFITCRDNHTYASVADVGFADYAAGDLNLRPDSPVFADMPFFVAVPFDEIGLRH